MQDETGGAAPVADRKLEMELSFGGGLENYSHLLPQWIVLHLHAGRGRGRRGAQGRPGHGDGSELWRRPGGRVSNYSTNMSPSMQDESPGGAAPKADRDMEMELTFGGGLEDLGQRLLTKKQEREGRKKDTVWEAYERRRRCSDLKSFSDISKFPMELHLYTERRCLCMDASSTPCNPIRPMPDRGGTTATGAVCHQRSLPVPQRNRVAGPCLRART